jgi:hypothetical protein
MVVKVFIDNNEDEYGMTSAKRPKEEVITPLVEVSQATVVHQLLQQGHNEVSINGIVAQNGTTTLQVRLLRGRVHFSINIVVCFLRLDQ